MDVLSLFNPVDCKSIGQIRLELAEIERGQILEVICNRFQHREIEAWTRKFGHQIMEIEDHDGRLSLYIEKGGR